MYKQLTAQELANKTDRKISSLKLDGYIWDKQLSISYVGVVMRKGKDIYVFDMEGNVHHNPETLVINV